MHNRNIDVEAEACRQFIYDGQAQGETCEAIAISSFTPHACNALDPKVRRLPNIVAGRPIFRDSRQSSSLLSQTAAAKICLLFVRGFCFFFDPHCTHSPTHSSRSRISAQNSASEFFDFEKEERRGRFPRGEITSFFMRSQGDVLLQFFLSSFRVQIEKKPLSSIRMRCLVE